MKASDAVGGGGNPNHDEKGRFASGASSSLDVGHNAGLAGESGLTGYRAARAARERTAGTGGGLPVSPTQGKIKRGEHLDMDELGAVASHVRSGGNLKPTEALHALHEAERHRDTETVRDSKGRVFPEDRRRAEEASRVHEDIRKHAVEVAKAGGHGQDATAQEILRRYSGPKAGAVAESQSQRSYRLAQEGKARTERAERLSHTVVPGREKEGKK